MAGPQRTDRFAGFADLYDANRPVAPAEVGVVLSSYARTESADVVDLGSGTGLSSRWAATWAASVVGVEPSTDMRAAAEARPTDRVRYAAATSESTGLPAGCADVVIAVQAMHWMEPEATLAEVARLLRPGGVFATVDADWPPVAGIADAERAWDVLHRRIRVFEARAARGDSGDALRAPIAPDDPALADEDLRDPHRNRAMPGGVRSWSKFEHLDRIRASGSFDFTRELCFDGLSGDNTAERFSALMRSQGSYQVLRTLSLDDDDLGASAFERETAAAYAANPPSRAMSFSWRVRLGVTPHR